MTDQSLQFPRFYVTAPSPCPYLEGKEERKVFTELTGDDSEQLYEALSRVGFRRSQSVAYRPACEGCNACISVRVVADEFSPTRTMRRIERVNKGLVSVAIDPWVTQEQFDLLKRYLSQRHADGGMATMDIYEYAEMVENSPVTTRIIEYRETSRDPTSTRPGRLIAAALTDLMSDGLSMIYSFF
ncbi:MAG: arginyltransferase, partial [Sphingomonadales bacterium]|nr:arginyltransferase [Sphingomonadales bacterium]